MSAFELQQYPVKRLLQMQSSILDELKRRSVVRTKNNPLGDYAEWLACTAMGLTLAPNSTTGYDAVDKDGVRFQIKARRVTHDNKSRQLSAIRKLDGLDFDYLIGILFDPNFHVAEAKLIPHHVVRECSTYRAHTNAHILHLRGNLLTHPEVATIQQLLGL